MGATVLGGGASWPPLVLTAPGGELEAGGCGALLAAVGAVALLALVGATNAADMLDDFNENNHEGKSQLLDCLSEMIPTNHFTGYSTNFDRL